LPYSHTKREIKKEREGTTSYSDIKVVAVYPLQERESLEFCVTALYIVLGALVSLKSYELWLELKAEI